MTTIVNRLTVKATCPYCGCLCDDIEVTVEDNNIHSVKNACRLGAMKIKSANSENRNLKYLIKSGNSKIEVTLDEALEETVNLLLNADKPVLYGWSNTSCEAQLIGLKIAKMLKGVWDNTTSVCHGTAAIATAESGIPSATLGEIKNRADLIIYWGSNPLESHPRHLKRYSYYTKGRFISKSKRKMIAIDVRETKTTRLSDKFILVKPNSDYKVISALHYIVKFGEPPERTDIGVSLNDLMELAKLIREAKFGVVFFGLGLTMTGYGYCNLDALYSLIQDLNKFGKWVTIPMRGHYNVSGANVVSTYMTGFPFAVDFSTGKPYYNPGETTIIDLLYNNECDLLMSVAADPLGTLPWEVISKSKGIKIIAQDPYPTSTTEAADIVLPTLICGVEAGGTAYRMDGVPIPLKPVVKGREGLLSDEALLKKILEKISQKVAR
ncbi:MAG: formylmethanofuran dehydrogenase subunit B [Candidatus Odinarchaeum yellowstonii]|uniref:Formylmethanofuran dehydrogenase subunit B n=1 Tax=Odinarchaeota yellowstonii (strain LCB_4) TaxID=1841599 RepID=A0AAF0IBU3_ODILC|nr:MAG: formylmethanofuran dehydrogenase subunit B [Candidatus Odinarchaeum yellowstonii]